RTHLDAGVFRRLELEAAVRGGHCRGPRTAGHLQADHRSALLVSYITLDARHARTDHQITGSHRRTRGTALSGSPGLHRQGGRAGAQAVDEQAGTQAAQCRAFHLDAEVTLCITLRSAGTGIVDATAENARSRQRLTIAV